MSGTDSKFSAHNSLSWAGFIITLGIIYGDIGTSPLYVMRAVVGDAPINSETVLGAVSLVFWTLTLQTTLKYVLIVLNADNNGEGGIFSLYSLVRRRAKWLIFPAMIGGCAMLADGMITPPISVASAIEGLAIGHPGIPIIGITIGIISFLFLFQRFGTAMVGRFFGPIMVFWFGMLAILGLVQIFGNWSVFNAINPYYAIIMLMHQPNALVIMGAVFLCTTGAEALYADLGHCGKTNIRASWIFVKTSLVLNYFGQAAWCMRYEGQPLPANPFYGIMPHWFLIIGIFTAAMAAIIASQAMISGSFSLVSEAIRLGLLPKLRVVFPNQLKGQLYIPVVNNFLWMGCIAVVLYFQESARMEAAYGLSVTLTMLTTSILLSNYLVLQRTRPGLIWSFLVWSLAFEGAFFIANAMKFKDGGFITILIALFLFLLMYIWLKAREIKNRYFENVGIQNYIEQLIALSRDTDQPKYATNLVFLSNAKSEKKVEEKILYSILETQPKRADVYWFVHIKLTDDPYTQEYKVNVLAQDDVYKVTFRLGFRIEQRMNLYMKKVVKDLIESGDLNIKARYHIGHNEFPTGDFRFVILQEFLSHENDLPIFEQFVMSIYLAVKSITASPHIWFGLDNDSVAIEAVPLVLRPSKGLKLKRIIT